MDIKLTVSALNEFFARFSLSVRTLSAKDIESEKYLRGHVDQINKVCICSVSIEREFDVFKRSIPDLQNTTLIFGGYQFIIK